MLLFAYHSGGRRQTTWMLEADNALCCVHVRICSSDLCSSPTLLAMQASEDNARHFDNWTDTIALEDPGFRGRLRCASVVASDSCSQDTGERETIASAARFFARVVPAYLATCLMLLESIEAGVQATCSIDGQVCCALHPVV